MESNKVKVWENWLDWLIYSVLVILILSPWLWGQWNILMSVGILIGLFFGFLNRIIKELCFIKRSISKT
jgi:hypothetical protein